MSCKTSFSPSSLPFVLCVQILHQSFCKVWTWSPKCLFCSVFSLFKFFGLLWIISLFLLQIVILDHSSRTSLYPFLCFLILWFVVHHHLFWPMVRTLSNDCKRKPFSRLTLKLTVGSWVIIRRCWCGVVSYMFLWSLDYWVLALNWDPKMKVNFRWE